MSTEDFLKNLVAEALKKKMGDGTAISQTEWNEAKIQALNDLYANKICLNSTITFAYFTDTMTCILAVMKRISEAV